MSANVNDDLIEATIRRVTQAKAAAARAGDDEAARRAAEPDPSASPPAVDYLQPAESADESAIEATIRRVAEAKAKADAADGDAPRDSDEAVASPSQHVDETAIEATIRRVAEAKAQAEASSSLPDGLSAPDLAASPVESAIGFAEAAVDDNDPLSDVSHPDIAASGATGAIDETAIEATIRRVAEAKAKAEAEAEESDASANDDVGATASTGTVDETAIEATIRRVAEAKAQAETARLSDDEAEERFGATANLDGTAIEATIRRVAEARAQAEAAELSDDETEERFGATANVDETAIEATIRRVAEAQAQAGATIDSTNDALDEPVVARSNIDDSAIEATPRIAESKAGDTLTPHRADSHALRTFMRASPDTALSDEPWRQTTDRMQREITSINAALITLAERLEALTEQLAAEASVRLPQTDQPAPSAEDDDEWDESPKILPLPTSLPPRPAIFRDPSPAAATAEPLVEETAQQIAPAPPPQATIAVTPPAPLPDTKRGFDLLPRTYRITIEDKRRSVDLVPLHRSLLAMDGVRDMSLLSYNNGVAIVALETVSDIDPNVLESIVGRAMSRGARVEQHNEYTLVVKLAEE